MTVATSLAVPKQASLYFQPIDWREKNLAPVAFKTQQRGYVSLRTGASVVNRCDLPAPTGLLVSFNVERTVD